MSASLARNANNANDDLFDSTREAYIGIPIAIADCVFPFACHGVTVVRS